MLNVPDMLRQTVAPELVHYLNEAKSSVFIALDLFNDKIIKAIPQTDVKTVVNMSLAKSMPLHIKAAFKLKTKVQKCDEFMSWKELLWQRGSRPSSLSGLCRTGSPIWHIPDAVIT